MNWFRLTKIAGLFCFYSASVLLAQPATNNTTKVPPLIKFSGTLTGNTAGAASGFAKITFAVYAEERGGVPLWLEVQNVQTDSEGRYAAVLGSTRNDGLPADLFASGQARWLGIQAEGAPEQPRSVMVSVPYALKAADAETVGGLPPSAFALAGQPVSTTGNVTASSKNLPFAAPPLGGTGTANYVPLWTDSSGDLGNSAIYQTGSGSTAKIGIKTTAPASALDVAGAAIVRGVLSATSYEIGNNPFAFGNFANGNAFVGFSGNSTTPGIENTANGVGALTENGSGSYNTADGYQALFGNNSGTLNTATGSQALYNSNGTGNTADGFKALAGGYQTAGVTGSYNSAVGYFALGSVTTGSYNTAVGGAALTADADGSYNTAVGYLAGATSPSTNYVVSGYYNTFLGYESGPGTLTALYNVTAIGANAAVSVNNALILGGTEGSAVSVGIGTATPYNDYALDVEATPGGLINGGIVSDSTGGNIFVGLTNGAHKFRVDVNGVTYADGGFQSSGADFAESFAVRGQRSLYEPGDVLEIDQRADRHLTLSHRPYATLVAGVYSTKPGLLASPRHIDDSAVETSEVPLAVVGVVPCKVTAENGTIARGDLLVTSSRPGYAMKGTNRQRMLGAVIGKALEPLPGGTGVIQVLITLQ